MAAATPLPFDPVLASLSHPPLTPEQQAELDDAMADIRAGYGIPHEAVQAEVDARLAQADALAVQLDARGIDPTILWEGTTEEVQVFCDGVFGTGADRVIIAGSSADEAAQAERRAYEERTGKKLVRGGASSPSG